MFELEWLGGAPEARFRKRRPGIEALPWGTLTGAGIDTAEARRVWTNGAFTEYASAAAFTAMAAAFLECGAPIDLTAAASDCATDELFHTELAARLVMELGGAWPFDVDLAKVSPVTTPGVRPLVRAAELAVKVSLVGEALSISALSASKHAASHPLTRAVLERLLKDEGAHAQVGHWFFEWASERLEAAERAHLRAVADAAIAVYAPLWQQPACERCVLPAEAGGAGDAHRVALGEAVERRVVPSLNRWGLVPVT
ncbi:MAG: ferritin-like domain-containing protein [Myxococcaceae bacterium]|nr:ferritin-like domain-containing protein [Myxococcaceae bacterium]